MYGTQTTMVSASCDTLFENDEKMYGTQTKGFSVVDGDMFENNVKMYGTQTAVRTFNCCVCLRMM